MIYFLKGSITKAGTQKDHISLPDIDMDVPAEHRDEVIDYIKQKYGEENVSPDDYVWKAARQSSG